MTTRSAAPTVLQQTSIPEHGLATAASLLAPSLVPAISSSSSSSSSAPASSSHKMTMAPSEEKPADEKHEDRSDKEHATRADDQASASDQDPDDLSPAHEKEDSSLGVSAITGKASLSTMPHKSEKSSSPASKRTLADADAEAAKRRRTEQDNSLTGASALAVGNAVAVSAMTPLVNDQNPQVPHGAEARQWSRVLDPTTRRVYYVNKTTMETTWTRPSSLTQRRSYWLRSHDPESGRLVWYNRGTGERKQEPRHTRPVAS